MYLWPFYTIAAVLFLAAIGLLYWGLWGDRSKSRLRCPKCWYDMTGSFEAGKLVLKTIHIAGEILFLLVRSSVGLEKISPPLGAGAFP